MDDEQRERRARTFDWAAQQYDARRPTYPDVLFDDIRKISGVNPPGPLLEIGSGTGLATIGFAARGYDVTCVELSENMAAVARKKLAAYRNVKIHVGAFEPFPLEPASFGLVACASAFHWLDPKVAWSKLAKTIRPGGAVALFWADNVYEPADPFIEAVQPIYRQHAPDLARAYDSAPPRLHETTAQQARAEGHFGEIAVRRYRTERSYDAREYTELLGTYSDHLLLEPQARSRLFESVGELIDTRFSGRITRATDNVLYVIRRV